jgi:hypothetical protein
MNGVTLIFPVLGICVLTIILSGARALLFEFVNNLFADPRLPKRLIRIAGALAMVVICCLLGILIIGLALLVLNSFLSA